MDFIASNVPWSVQTKGKICAKVENADFAHPFTTFAQILP